MAYRVLIIEDDPSSARLVEYLLKKEGYEVAIATNGIEGLRKARSDIPDLAILDVMLPGLDGFEVSHRLKSEPRTRNIPILMLSAKSREIDKSTGYKVGADAYLPKPSEPAEILQTVARLIRQRATSEVVSKAVLFLGSKDGIGTTTIIANIAILLAQAGNRVVLLDLFPYAGDAARYLGMEPRQKLDQFLGNAEAKPEIIDSLFESHASGLQLLSGVAGRLEDQSGRLKDLLEYFKNKVNYILIDLPVKEMGILKQIGEKLDRIILITNSSPDGLTNMRTKTSYISEELKIQRDKILAVIVDREGLFNRVESDKLQNVVETMVQLPVIGIIPYDVKASLDFETRGKPVVAVEPDRPIAVAMRKIAAGNFEVSKQNTIK